MTLIIKEILQWSLYNFIWTVWFGLGRDIMQCLVLKQVVGEGEGGGEENIYIKDPHCWRFCLHNLKIKLIWYGVNRA